MTVMWGLDTRLRLAKLFCVTDARAGSGDLEPFAAALCDGGADVLQLSDGRLGRRAQLEALGVLRRASARRRAVVAVWGDAELASQFASDMLVVPPGVGTPDRARVGLQPGALVGRSCRTRAEADAALADPGVDFLIVTADLGSVRYAAQRAPQGDPASKPWFAAGGVTVDYLPELADAGCRRVVVSRALVRAKDPGAEAARFSDALAKIWSDDPAMEKVTMAAFRAKGSPHG